MEIVRLSVNLNRQKARKRKMSSMQLATYIKSCRKNIGLTQKELAEKVGVSTNTVARWERNESEPSFSDFLKPCYRDWETDRKSVV